MRKFRLCCCGIHRSDPSMLLLVVGTLIVVGTGALLGCRPQESTTAASAERATTAPIAKETTTLPAEAANKVRRAAVAGAFYPAKSAQAEQMLDQLLAPVRQVDGRPIALIVPHAGWVYSGHIAAHAYKQIEGRNYDAIVIVAPNHTDPYFKGISVFARGEFQTPLGPSPIDEHLADEIIASHPRIVFERNVHLREHSIEVQLPFLNRTCPGCTFVPIIIGEETAENIAILTDALTNALAGKRALIIASSDLSHYPKYEDAIRVDTQTLSAIETMDDGLVSAVMADQMADDVPGLLTCACGRGPIVVALRVAAALGADHARILRYANSGDVGGDLDRVVGYASVMLWRWEPPKLTDEEKTGLLGIARQAIEKSLSGDTVLAAETPEASTVHRQLGAFVTLTLDGQLRGCVGNLQGDKPLYEAVAAAAVDAAINDPRFPPLDSEEFTRTAIEIFVLSPFRRVRDVRAEAQIELGRHGLYVFFGERRGLLLPQVPINEGWDRGQFLEQVCKKAELPVGCWKWAALYTFTAEVFGEARELQ